MNNHTKGKILEDYVEYVYKFLLDLDSNPDDEPIVISRNVRFSKGEYSNEFDIYYQFSKAGVRHQVAIECKNHHDRIDIGHIRNFNDKLRDFNITGVFVSNSGFQSGAEYYAKEKNILLLKTEQLPNFINLIGFRIQQIFLPSKHVKGEPFYILMEHFNGELTGSYHVVELSQNHKVMLLFLSKKLAIDYLHVSGESDLKIRGLKQEAFDFFILAAKNFGATFQIICFKQDDNDGHLSFEIAPEKLKAEYFDLLIKD